MIRIENLRKQYGDFVLDIPSLLVPAGQSFGLVGNNGAGKTTLFNLILDLIRPGGGKVYIRQIPVAEDEGWKKYVGAFLDESFLIPYLTPDEYFDFLAKLRGVSEEEKEKILARFDRFFDGEIRGKPKYIRDLSKGNQKKVGIAGAFIGMPSLIILDEPFANLDPSGQIKLKRLLNEFRDNYPVTFLISSHNLEHITDVTDRIVILDDGKIRKDIPVNQNTLQELIRYFEEQIAHDEI